MPTGEFEKLKIYAYTDPGCGDDQLAALDFHPAQPIDHLHNRDRCRHKFLIFQILRLAFIFLFYC